MKLSDYVFDFIAGLGVKDVFLLPGGGCMHLVDSLGKHPRLAYHALLHEQAVAIAADAYSQYTNHLGVALVTTGPGGTNALTGVAGSWLDSIPVLIISGQVKRPDIAGEKHVRQLGFQELDIVSIVRPITKYAVTIIDPDTIAYELGKAVHSATSGRSGPVWVDIPLDVQAATIDPPRLKRYQPPAIQRPTWSMDRFSELLSHSRRPVLLVGNGIRLAKAVDALRTWTESMGIPVMTTWKAADLYGEHDPLYIGRPGSIGQRGANFALQNSDCWISIGARLDFGQIGYEHRLVAPDAKKIIVDIDENEINKLKFPVDLTYPVDARSFLDELQTTTTGEYPRAEWQRWLEQCKKWQKQFDPIEEGRRDLPGFVDEYTFIKALSRQLTPTDIVIPGSSGACSEVTMQALKIKAGQRVFNTQGLGPMGFALPAAIGGCVASGIGRVITIDGDGGFAMNLQELATVQRRQFPIKYFILRNQGYGSIRVTQQRYFQDHYVACDQESGLSLPSIGDVGRGFGIQTVMIRTNEELDSGIEEVLAKKGPVICELNISPEQATRPRLSSKQLADGSFVSASLEELVPELDRDILKKIMSVGNNR